jgi:hypothetical protein
MQEPKRRSNLTATKHSQSGKIHIATAEETTAFDKHCQAYTEALAPVGTLEEELAHEIAEDRWRLKRARSVENAIFAVGHQQHAAEFPSGHPEVDAALAEGKTWLGQSRQLQLLTLYEGRIRRAIAQNTLELKAMQAERKAAYAQAQRQAIVLSRVAQSDGEPYDPVADFSPAEEHGGFVFDASAIARVIDRARRLERGMQLPVQ